MKMEIWAEELLLSERIRMERILECNIMLYRDDKIVLLLIV